MTKKHRDQAARKGLVRVLPRREFLKIVGASTAAAMLGCDRQWSVPERLVALALRGPGLETHANTICGLCEGGCGLTVRLVDGLPVGIKGNPGHPLNRGGLCPVGPAALEVLYAPERLRGPLTRGSNGEHEPTTWESALGDVSSRLSELRAAGAGARFAILTDEPGQLFHELAVRFAAAIGSSNVSRSVTPRSLPFLLTQGLNGVPSFDLARADLVLSFGLDIYEDGPAPVHAISALAGARASGARCTLLHVGTRLSPSAAKAKEYLPVRPGTHGALALGIAHVIVREGKYDERFVAEHTRGFEDWTDDLGRRRMGFRRLLMERYYPDRVSQICGCDAGRILRISRRLAAASAPVALSGGEALAGSNATWTAMAVHSLNALVGAFQQQGGVLLPQRIPFSPLEPLPGQGGEGGPSLFTASSDSDRFGKDPVEALVDGVLDGSHPLDVLFLVHTNPVYSSPIGQRLGEALEKIPLVLAMTQFRDETAAQADLILPTHVFLEAWQEVTTPETVAMSSLGLSHPVVEPLFDTRHPGDSLLALASSIGDSAAAALPWTSYEAYLKHRFSGLVASGQGAVARGEFEESWVSFLEERGWRFLKHETVDRLWNDLAQEAGWWTPARTEADWRRVFATPSGRFEFCPDLLSDRLRTSGQASTDDEVCLPHYEPAPETGSGEITFLCFRPITARGRLGTVSPMLLEMFGHSVFSGWTTWVELSPETASEFGLEHGDRVAVESDGDSIVAEVRVQSGNVPGVAHVPLGLGHSELNRREGGIGTNPAHVVMVRPDSLDGALSLHPTRVRLRLVQSRKHGGPPPHEGGHT